MAQVARELKEAPTPIACVLPCPQQSQAKKLEDNALKQKHIDTAQTLRCSSLALLGILCYYSLLQKLRGTGFGLGLGYVETFIDTCKFTASGFLDLTIDSLCMTSSSEGLEVSEVMNSEWIGEMHDAKIGLTGKPMKAEYKRLTLEEEQASPPLQHCVRSVKIHITRVR